MIHLDANDVAEFRDLFKKETGKDITDAQAREYAMNLLHLVTIVLQPESFSSDL